jgi:hypothetical protein
MKHSQTIYIELLHEGVTVYRPVEAKLEDDGAYRLPGEAPEGEEWAFAVGSRVYCEWRELDTGRTLVAVRAAPTDEEPAA